MVQKPSLAKQLSPLRFLYDFLLLRQSPSSSLLLELEVEYVELESTSLAPTIARALPRLSFFLDRRSSLCLFLCFDRGGVPDLLVSGDKSDLVVVDPHDPTTTSETRSANAIAEPTHDGYRPCWRKISLITKINSCAQSKNEQEYEASNLNITRMWSLNYTTAARWRLLGSS
jgi:hypothetical protein